MHRLLAASLALAFLLPAPGAALAQSEGEPSPATSASPAPSTSPAASADPTAAASAPATLVFEAPVWQEITPIRGPAPREDHTWTVDGEGRYAYLFGGRDGGKAFGDLWRYDLRNDTWKKLSPDGRKPAPRFGHSAVWVDGHGVIVFAGQRGADFFGDLWAYDPERDRWKVLPARGAPPKRRYGSCMIVGPDGRLWISHGFTFQGRFDDTRAYNLTRKRWASVAPPGRRPGERCLHDCFTNASGQLVLYGGQDDGAFALGDLWRMRSDRSWKKETDPKPEARRLYALTEAGDDAWIFGGAGADDGLLDDLWRVDRETLEFQRVRVDGRSPAPRYAGTLISDVARGRLLLFGGQGKVAKADVWQLVDGSSPPDEVEPMSDGAIDSSPAPEPSASPEPAA